MDIDSIIQIISNVGFPMFVVVYLLWHGEKEEQAHKEEMEKMTQALNSNTLILQKLVDRIDAMKGTKNDTSV